MARKSKNKKEVKTDGWLATYSDTVTLLLTFFVLLYSMSTVDAQKFNQIAVAMQSMFTGQAAQSILEFNMSNGEVPIVGKPHQTATEVQENENEDILEDIMKYIEENNLEGEVQIYSDQKGLNIELKDRVLFDTGKANLKPESLEVLDKVSTLLANVDNDIIIEGHTDNVPINTPSMPNNYHLSTARALSVLDYLIATNSSLDPAKISPQGYGEYRPIASNDTAEGRAQNRRVNIIVVTNKDSEEEKQDIAN